MKLAEALQIRQTETTGSPLAVGLACGFTPLHLETFLAAHLAQSTQRPIEIETGLFGDLPGNVERIARNDNDIEACAVVVEWQDLDPRLGYRRCAPWGSDQHDDIADGARARLGQLDGLIRAHAQRVPLAVALPTLPLPPIDHRAGAVAGALEFALRRAVDDFGKRLANVAGIRLASPQWLNLESPLAARFDLRSDLAAGFPYTPEHADRLASALARLIQPPARLKGLITDLDDTLWKGLVGETGPEGVHWDLDHQAHIHGLYQQLLASLAEAGVLIGVASRNEPAVVEAALDRADLLLPRECLFPIECHWEAKSRSVTRILEAWNISADAVMFVDDSPLELAGAERVHSGLHSRRFPADDENAALRLFRELRDLFGRDRIMPEDRLRRASLGASASIRGTPPGAEANRASEDAFLQQAEAQVTVLETHVAAADPRALELVNKTNQFNLNGRRYGQGEWNRLLRAGGTELLVIDYRDKFGPLGKIAAIVGRREPEAFRIVCWVMSCRAFARRIEHRSLELLFRRFGCPALVLDYEPTEKNRPLARFLESLTGKPLDGEFRLTRVQFEAACPALYHDVRWAGEDA